jgi:hypothetical protein
VNIGENKSEDSPRRPRPAEPRRKESEYLPQRRKGAKVMRIVISTEGRNLSQIRYRRTMRTQRLCGKVFFFSCISRGKLCIVAAINHARRGFVMKRIFFVFAFVLVSSVIASAQAPFYQDKTLRIVAGYGAGSVDDAWTRLIAQYLGKYIPGIQVSSSRTCPGPAQ